MVKSRSRRAFLPGLLALAAALLVSGVVYWSSRPQPAPPPPAPGVRALEFPPHVPAPLPPDTPSAPPAEPVPPALLQVRVLVADASGPVPPSRLFWAQEPLPPEALEIPASGVLEATLPPDLYRFRVWSEEHLCLEERNLLLEPGEVRPVTFTLRPATRLGVHVRATIRGGAPAGARIRRAALPTDYTERLLHFQPARNFPCDASGDLQLTHLLPGARYEIIAEASGCLEQRQEIVAGEVQAVTFYLNTGSVLAGTVRDEQTGARLAGVQLLAYGRGSDPRVSTSTADGSFEFTGLWPGQYWIEPASGHGILSAHGSPMPLEILLGERKSDVLILLSRGGSLVVRLMDPRSGEVWDAAALTAAGPLPEVLVTGYGGRSWRQRFTHGGEQHVTGLPDGEYEVRLERVGPWPAVVRYTRIEEAGTAEVELPALPGDFIAGSVVDWEGRPVAGAAISRQLHGEKPYSPWEESFRALGGRADTTSSATGYFELRGLAPGVYDLVGRAAGAAPGMLAGVLSGQDDVQLRLPEGATLQVRVLDADNHPRPNVEIVLTHAPILNAAGLLRSTLRTDAEGWAQAAHLPEGGYLVEARRGARRAPEWRMVQLEDGQSTQLLFGGGVTLSGRVEVDGQPAAPATARPGQGALIGRAPMWLPYRQFMGEILDPRTRTDESGRYTLTGLPAGQSAWIAIGVAGLEVVPQYQVKLPTEGTATQDFVIRTGAITGRVVDGQGAPLDGVEVSVMPVEGETLSSEDELALAGLASLIGELWTGKTQTDLSGRFRLAKLVPGDYLVGVRDRQNIHAVERVTLSEAGRAREVELVLNQPGALRGRVQGPGGTVLSEPLALLLRDREGMVFPYQARVEATNGHFRVDGIPPGTYDAVVTAGLTGAFSMPARARRVVIRSGAESYAEFRLRAGFPVQLAAFDAWDGQAVVGVKVEVRHAGGGRARDLGSLSGIYNLWVGVLPEGRFVLRVSHPDYERAELPLDLSGEARTRFLSVRMRRASGG